jgi:transposase
VILIYIRQQCLFSFEELIKLQPETKLTLVFKALDLSKVVGGLQKKSRSGPKGYDPENILRALLAKRLENIKYTKTLVEHLKSDPVFRYTCGFPVVSKVPSEATFSRFIKSLAYNICSLEDILEDLVIKAKKLGIIGGEHIAIDTSKLDSYDASVPKSRVIQDREHPDWGSKRDTHGNQARWFGWKLHTAVDTKSELPVSVNVTPASVNDGIMAVPLVEDIQKRYSGIINPKYYIMDMGYDIEHIYRTIHDQYNAQAIIPMNRRSAYAPPAGLDWDCTPLCSMGYWMAYWGYDNGYIKFRCPHMAGKVNCPMGTNWCSSGNYGAVVKKKISDNPRYFTYPRRGSPKWQKLYSERTAVERAFSRLKENLGLNNITVRGIRKTRVHVLLSCIALIAGTIAVNVSKESDKAA